MMSSTVAVGWNSTTGTAGGAAGSGAHDISTVPASMPASVLGGDRCLVVLDCNIDVLAAVNHPNGSLVAAAYLT
ncbi:MAG: hypothetical protein CL477_15435 [Acidobacteria bacterium]|nr:hypothetical protein [Acidobacteriota bacterium]|tara:strand:+ start:2078 stop:2299 length:222 start_codon:yes stop_codon:yes gene_type:complete